MEHAIEQVLVVKPFKRFVCSLDLAAFKWGREDEGWHRCNGCIKDLLLRHVLVDLTEVEHLSRLQQHQQALLGLSEKVLI